MLLGLINLGSTSAFTAFVSVGVQALALAYSIPIAVSLFCKRSEVNRARWNLGQFFGTIVNIFALLWIGFELVLFSMPTVRVPLTAASMNYASALLMGFACIAVRTQPKRYCNLSNKLMTVYRPFGMLCIHENHIEGEQM